MSGDNVSQENLKMVASALFEIIKLRTQALDHGVPYNLLGEFYNDYQLAAVIAKVGHEVAHTLNSLEKISDYFAEHTDKIPHALAGLIPVVTMSELMAKRGSKVFNYVPVIVVQVKDLIVEMAKAMQKGEVTHSDADTVLGGAFDDASSDADTRFESAFSSDGEENIGLYGSFLSPEDW